MPTLLIPGLSHRCCNCPCCRPVALYHNLCALSFTFSHHHNNNCQGDGKTIQSAVVSVSPAHLTANHQFKGLNAGETYKFKINAVGPGGNGPQNGPLGE